MIQKEEHDKYIRWFSELGKEDIKLAGGKGANLGEMYNAGMPVPQGFAITTEAYSLFLERTGLDEKIKEILKEVKEEDTKKLNTIAKEIRDLIEKEDIPEKIQQEISEAYENLSVDKKILEHASKDALDILKRGYELAFVAVRSSATAEDSSETSFAGQNETFLNVKGKTNLLKYVKACWASLFTARSIYYRIKNNLIDKEILISVIVQQMVNSDKSGVIFSKDPINQTDNIVVEAVFGLGEGVVSGKIQPDHYVVSRELKILSKDIGNKKIAIIRNSAGNTETVSLTEERSNSQVLSDYEIKKLSSYAVELEEHYNKPQDIEFAVDSGIISIVQTRPITTLGKVKKENLDIEKGELILEGMPASPGVASGIVKIIRNLEDLDKIKKGDILVTKMTNPDMVVSMQKANAIVTDEGGATSHASIVSREMGIPCFSGDTLILTNKGFMQLKEVNKKILERDNIYTLSFNTGSLKTEWKKILNSSKRLSKTITASISKNGKIDWNIINTTPEHKFFNLENRKPSYKEINKIIEQDNTVYIANRIPPFNQQISNFNDKKAYVCGAIFSDGYLRIQKDGTSSTVFVQKNIPEKASFINEVCNNFYDTYNYQLKLVKPSYYYCYRKDITQELMEIYSKLDNLTLACPQSSLLQYISSIIDGDGNFIRRGRVIKISLDAKDTNLLQSLVISCIRLGLNYRIKKENNQFRFYITSKLDMLVPYLKRVSIDKSVKVTGDTYFPSKQLFSDVPVSGRKGIKSFVKNNCLLSGREISEKIIPFVKDNLKEFLLKLINSDIGALRVKKISDNKPEDVFNIEVEDNNNYVVFTKYFTPLIVKNCVVGTREATSKLEDGLEITVDGFNGKVYLGAGKIKTEEVKIKKEVKTKTKIKVMVDLPDYAERAGKTGIKEVGLTRIEGIIAESRKHPYLFLKDDRVKEYEEIIYSGLCRIAKYFDKIWVRTSDIRSDEYMNLEGAPKEKEDNPMLGMHGIRASLVYPDLLKAELKAMRRVAKDGKKIGVLIPQLISVEEIRRIKKMVEEIDFHEAEIGVMVETPAAVQIIEELCKEGIDFISFGTNDLTQYTLAVDRGNQEVQYLYDELHPSILSQLAYVIKICKIYNVETSICGQAGSKKEMVDFLIKHGIDSISVNADKAYEISEFVHELEKKGLKGAETDEKEYLGEITVEQEKEKKEEETEEFPDMELNIDIFKEQGRKVEWKIIEKAEEVEKKVVEEVKKIEGGFVSEIKELIEHKEAKPIDIKRKHEIVCESCGKNAEVPFKPKPGIPVYCRECYRNKKQEKLEKQNKSENVEKARKEPAEQSYEERELTNKEEKKENKTENKKDAVEEEFYVESADEIIKNSNLDIF